MKKRVRKKKHPENKKSSIFGMPTNVLINPKTPKKIKTASQKRTKNQETAGDSSLELLSSVNLLDDNSFVRLSSFQKYSQKNSQKYSLFSHPKFFRVFFFSKIDVMATFLGIFLGVFSGVFSGVFLGIVLG